MAKKNVTSTPIAKPQPAKMPEPEPAKPSFETRVEELMAGTERSHMDGMRREDAERIALQEGLKRRGRV